MRFYFGKTFFRLYDATWWWIFWLWSHQVLEYVENLKRYILNLSFVFLWHDLSRLKLTKLNLKLYYLPKDIKFADEKLNIREIWLAGEIWICTILFFLGNGQPPHPDSEQNYWLLATCTAFRDTGTGKFAAEILIYRKIYGKSWFWGPSKTKYGFNRFYI